jgi:hypothetical protein
VYFEIPSPETSLPLDDVVDPSMESDDDERGMLLLSPRPNEETEYPFDDDSLADDSLPVLSEEEFEASREDDDT